MTPELVETLDAERDRLLGASAVVLPDLYVDHLVPLDDREQLEQGLDQLIAQGGGNLVTPGHRLMLGGNAANTARALAGLGVPTTLVAQTDAVGHTLFEEATAGLPLSADGLMRAGRSSSTVALELADEGANVMLSDPGPLADLAPDDLDEAAWSSIEAADVVAVTNWAQMLEHGTDLVAEVVSRAGQAGVFTFLDTADPAHRGDAVHDLLGSKTLQRDLSAWGMNEHEACWFAGALLDREPTSLDVEAAVRALGEHVAGRIEVHTAKEAISLVDGQLVRAATFPATPTHRTGAGDAWNAGRLAGELLDLPDAQRLRLANAVAALTITGQRPGPPSLEDVRAFLADR